MLDVDRRGNGIGELAQIGQPADMVQLAPSVEIVAQGNEVRGLLVSVKVEHGLEDVDMLAQVEVGRLQEGRHAGDGDAVDQQAAQDGLFGVDILRQQPVVGDNRFFDRGMPPPLNRRRQPGPVEPIRPRVPSQTRAFSPQPFLAPPISGSEFLVVMSPLSGLLRLRHKLNFDVGFHSVVELDLDGMLAG